jgi:hypothetical protein
MHLESHLSGIQVVIVWSFLIIYGGLIMLRHACPTYEIRDRPGRYKFELMHLQEH